MKQPVELTTDRLLLRPFRTSDAADLQEYANDREWVRYQVNVPHPFTQQNAQQFVDRFSNPYSWSTQPMFAMVIGGKVIGQIYLHFDDSDIENERAELGYMLSREHWGGGLATEAARAVVDWAFQTYGINRVFAYCDPRNVGSWRVMEKLGMRREGLLRQHLKWNGEYRDALYYGILRDEWGDQAAEKLKGGTNGNRP
jgi:ribosomal-protein-alanine N-acetyltransferase